MNLIKQRRRKKLFYLIEQCETRWIIIASILINFKFCEKKMKTTDCLFSAWSSNIRNEIFGLPKRVPFLTSQFLLMTSKTKPFKNVTKNLNVSSNHLKPLNVIIRNWFHLHIVTH